MADQTPQLTNEVTIVDLTSAIEQDPTDANIYVKRGKSFARLQCNTEAVADFSRAIDLDPSLTDAYLNRGICYYSQECLDEALRDLTQTVVQDPANILAYLYRGLIYGELQRHVECIEDNTLAINLDPFLNVAYFNRGVSFERLGQDDKAMVDYTRAIELDQTYVKAYINRGLTYLRMQRHSHLKFYDQVLSDLSRAIELDLNNTLAYKHRGIVYDQLGLHEEAIADESRAIELTPNDAEGYMNRCAMYINIQHYEEALVDCTRAIELNPSLERIYTSRGACYFNLKRYDEALRDFNQSIQLDPNDELAYYNAGLIMETRGALNEALIYYEHAVRLGHSAAVIRATRIRQELVREPVIEDRPFQLAFAAFQQANSFNDIRHVVELFPFVNDNDFRAAVEQATEQIPSELKASFHRRLTWANQVANGLEDRGAVKSDATATVTNTYVSENSTVMQAGIGDNADSQTWTKEVHESFNISIPCREEMINEISHSITHGYFHLIITPNEVGMLFDQHDVIFTVGENFPTSSKQRKVSSKESNKRNKSNLVISLPYKDGDIVKVSYRFTNGYLHLIIYPSDKGLGFSVRDILFTRGNVPLNTRGKKKFSVSFPHIDGSVDKFSYSVEGGYFKLVMISGNNGFLFTRRDVVLANNAILPSLNDSSMGKFEARKSDIRSMLTISIPSEDDSIEEVSYSVADNYLHFIIKGNDDFVTDRRKWRWKWEPINDSSPF